MKLIGSSLFAIALAFATGAQAQDANAKLSPKVQKMLHSKASFPVLIYLKAKADLTGADSLATKEEKGKFVYAELTKVAAESQKDLLKFLTDKSADFERYHIVNMVAVFNANADLVKAVAARDDVARVVSNDTFKGVPQQPVNKFEPKLFEEAGIEASITSTGAPKAWSEFDAKGQGVVIAGQDTGVQWDHPALKNHYRGTTESGVSHDYNWYDAITRRIDSGSNPCGMASKVPCDDHGHGTHTVGTVVGDDGKGNQIGMAPEAKWIACRNMDNGTGRATSYIRCFEFFLAPFTQAGNPMTDGKPELAPHVINNSWGCDDSEGCQGDEMVDVLAATKAAGIVTVVSAGNDGSSCSTIKSQPATVSPYTLSVGAHDHRSGNIASFSSRGPSTLDNEIGPDVTAPGVSIRSAVPGNRYESFQWSGTSMAGPHVAGQVALLISAQKQLAGNVAAIFDLIRSTATAKTSTQTCGGVSGSKVPNNTFGYGHINAYDATKKALAL